MSLESPGVVPGRSCGSLGDLWKVSGGPWGAWGFLGGPWASGEGPGNVPGGSWEVPGGSLGGPWGASGRTLGAWGSLGVLGCPWASMGVLRFSVLGIELALETFAFFSFSDFLRSSDVSYVVSCFVCV